MKKQKQTNDNPEWTQADFARAVPISALPESLRDKLASGRRGPQKAPTKKQISIRLSADVVDALRASGRGWQSRVDKHLREWLKRKRA